MDIYQKTISWLLKNSFSKQSRKEFRGQLISTTSLCTLTIATWKASSWSRDQRANEFSRLNSSFEIWSGNISLQIRMKHSPSTAVRHGQATEAWNTQPGPRKAGKQRFIDRIKGISGVLRGIFLPAPAKEVLN